MARVTINEVKVILEDGGTGVADGTLATLINTASSIIETNASSSYDEAVLKELELWLSAHLVHFTVMRLAQKEKIGEADVSYQSMSGLGLNGTPYGQTLSLIDTKGVLRELGKRKIFITAVPPK